MATNTATVALPPTVTPVAPPPSPGQPESVTGAGGQAVAPTPTEWIGADAAPGTATDNGQGQDAILEQMPFEESLDCETRIEIYQTNSTSDPALAPYEAPTIANCYLELGDRPAAITVYESAVAGGADRITEVALRQALAGLFVEDGDYRAALAQYEAILAMAETDKTRGQTIYQAGRTEILAGNPEAGYARYLTLINGYPAVSESYQALMELIAAGYAVDDYQQGLVVYHADDYEMAAAAFGQAIEANLDYTSDAYLYLAWSLEKLGNLDEALSYIDTTLEAGDPDAQARSWMERAKMQERAGRYQAAMDDYQTYRALFPQSDQASLAAWKTAALAEELGYLTVAVERYLEFAETFPEHTDAAEALFRAGYLSSELDLGDEALSIWQRAVEAYPEQEYGAASLLWLLKNDTGEDADPFTELAIKNNGQSYYALRARHLASGVEPFFSPAQADLDVGDVGQSHAESWLREWLGLDAQVPVADLSSELDRDPQLRWGEQLWRTGLRSEATVTFERLRADYAHDALASYQLALYFRELGLYRSSILAATSIMNLAGATVSTAPRFIARLAYPTYYADLVLSEASSYGYDPLLQLALIREESYFDALGTSAAGAQGLSQLLPEVGATVAQALGWPNYKDGDLYRPEVAIAFGAFYFDSLLDDFNGNIAVALSAYNAGPGNAAQWAKNGSGDFDLFLEAVDFPETQRYIKQIYTTQAIYRFLYG